MRVHQRGIALQGERRRGIEACDQHRNFQWQTRAAPDGMLSFVRSAHRVSRQEILRPEDLELKTRDGLRTSTGNAGNNCPRTMLDHKNAPGTQFRRPVSSLTLGTLEQTLDTTRP